MSSPAVSIAVLSGWGISHDILAPWLDHFSDQFELHLVEIPDLSAGVLLENRSRMEALLAKVPDGSYWIGWSLGGAIALDLALYASSRVSGVITLATNPCFIADRSWPGMERETFLNFQREYSLNPEKTLQRFAALQLKGAHSPRTQLKQLKQQLLSPEPVLADLLELLAVDRRSALHALNVPWLALLADADALVPEVLVEKLMQEITAVQVERVSGASHLLFQDQPEICVRLVRDWINEQGSFSHA